MVEPIVIRLNRRIASVATSRVMPEPPANPVNHAELQRMATLDQREAAVEQQRVELQAEREGMLQANAAMLAVAQKLSQYQQRLADEAEENLLELSLQMARKVLMQEIQAGRYEIDPILAEAISKLPPRQDATVRLNPQDLARSGLAKSPPSGETGTLTYVADPTIAPGECVLESSDGVLESRIDTHMDEIARALRGHE